MSFLAIDEYQVALPRWGCELALAVTEDGSYHSINELCAVLGVKNSSDQATRLRERIATQPYVKQLRIKTRGGKQFVWCIHQRALGYWLGTINDKLVRSEVLPHLVEFQGEVLTAAHRALFGIVDDDAQANIIRLQDYFGKLPPPEDVDEDEESDIVCPRCGFQLARN